MATPELLNNDLEKSSSLNDEKFLSHSDDSSTDVAKEDANIDVVVGLIAGHIDDVVDPVKAKKLRRKLDLFMIPLLLALYTLQYFDKNSIASSSILGILKDAHLTTDDFNNLGTAFYGGYITFVGVHALLMQRFPIAKYVAVNIFLWSLFLGLQATCTNYSSLFALRFFLGGSESCVTTAVMTIMTMFYTRTESTQRISWTFQCNGFAAILMGFVSYGVAHINAKHKIHPWQWFQIIICLASFVLSVLFFFFFPDNPASAWFLSREEKTDVVQRIRTNQNGVETKRWKRHQFIETMTDVKAWLFLLYGAVVTLEGGIGVEYSLIIQGFGYDVLQTTLLGIPNGAAQIFGVTTGTILIWYFPNSRCLLGIIGFLPSIASCFLLLFLPWHNKHGLLISMYVMQTNGLGFIMILSLCAVCFAGHTKKMTVNAMFLIGYALGQMLSTQFWKQKYRPRNTVPWIIQLSTFVGDIIIISILWYILRAENKRRDAEKAASGEEYPEYGYVEHVQEDGTTVKTKVPIQFLDLTDKENKAFRYPS